MGGRGRVAIVVVLALLVAGGALAPAAGAAKRPTPWVLASDVHFTPFVGASKRLIARLQAAPVRRWKAILAPGHHQLSPSGDDTNATLLESALAAMRRTAARPPVVMLSGDLLGHDFQQTYQQLAPRASTADYRRFVDKTIAYLARRFDATFPHAQFVLTLGNDDSYCGDYALTPNSPFLLHTARSWKRLVDRHGRAPGFVASFRQLGAYVARLPIRGLQAIALDDVFWSAKYENSCGTPKARPGAAQAAWLKRAVRHVPAANRALIVTHIPPGVDAYATLQAGGPPVALLTQAGQNALLGALGPRVPAVVFGHLHMSTFGVSGQTPLLGVPSVSPIFGNDPAFYTATVTRAGIADFTAHALDLGARSPKWRREYGFRDTYGLPAFTASALDTLHDKLANDAGLRAAYERYYASGGEGQITEAQYPSYACATIALGLPEYSGCLASTSGG
jgi:sphingomyelin phosphodiesterase acid-like 3